MFDFSFRHAHKVILDRETGLPTHHGDDSP
jgi:hypothetical protein